MIRAFIINKYITKEFLKVVISITFAFLCLGFIFNLFEEINFFKDYNVGIIMPVLMSALFVPNMVYNIFPFIILLSGIWFFLKIKKSDEIIAMKSNGMSNLSLIIITGFISLVLGVFFVTSVNPLTSTLVKKYEAIQSSYEHEKESLASVTVNGIWIKESKYGKNYIIKSLNLENDTLINITIYEFDDDYNFIRKINSNKANIESTEWKLENVTFSDIDGAVTNHEEKIFYYKSFYDLKKIVSLYSNLDTVSFWNLNEEIKLLENRGYSTKKMETKLQKSFAFPFFLLSMLILSGAFTLSTNYKQDKSKYIFIAIISSVLIFYFNDFSAALGKTDKLTVKTSVWMPIAIIFIFSSIGVLHANQK
jgi:lipopolysaccharide export system permease protein